MPLFSPRLICLDRDGVINEDSDAYVKNPDEWIPIPGSLEAIAKLTRAGITVVVVSNQAGVFKGKFTEENLTAMTTKMLDLVEKFGGKIHKVFYCLHDPDLNCRCRKPAPGMLLDAAAEFKVSPEELIFVGDRSTDMQAAWACGAKPILVKTGKGERELLANPALADQVIHEFGAVYENLSAFVRDFLKTLPCETRLH
jgi:D-glycero-D-manno-heptose 1,7-bisphosphate phosphatase